MIKIREVGKIMNNLDLVCTCCGENTVRVLEIGNKNDVKQINLCGNCLKYITMMCLDEIRSLFAPF